MTRPFLIVCINVLFLMGWQAEARPDDPVANDEAAIAAKIKALHDPKNDVRATAAAELRRIVAKYPSGTSNIREKDSGEAYWMKNVKQVKPGMKEADVLKLLPPFSQSPEQFINASGDSHVDSYRLDLHWTVTIQYQNPDKVIERPKLSRREFYVDVKPPENFTGTWVNWYVNGQKGSETQFKNGKLDGTSTAYYDTGVKSYEQHLVNHVAHGTGTGWYSDGKLMYTGQYRNGKQDGKWVHWYPNGTKQQESNYNNSAQDGLFAGWYKSGQKQFEMNYKNGIKHGVEAGWTEQGRQEYKREFENGKVVE